MAKAGSEETLSLTQLVVEERDLGVIIDGVSYMTTYFEEHILFALERLLPGYLHFPSMEFGDPKRAGDRWGRQTAINSTTGVGAVYSRWLPEGRKYDPHVMNDHKQIEQAVTLVRDPYAVRLENQRFELILHGCENFRDAASAIKYGFMSFKEMSGISRSPDVSKDKYMGRDVIVVKFGKKEDNIQLEDEVLFMYRIISGLDMPKQKQEPITFPIK